MADEPIKPNKLKAVAKVPSSDTIKTEKGNIVTKQQWQTAAKNGLAFNSQKEYADYVDSWAKPVKEPLKPNKTKAVKKDYFDKSAGGMRYHY